MNYYDLIIFLSILLLITDPNISNLKLSSHSLQKTRTNKDQRKSNFF